MMVGGILDLFGTLERLKLKILSIFNNNWENKKIKIRFKFKRIRSVFNKIYFVIYLFFLRVSKTNNCN